MPTSSVTGALADLHAHLRGAVAELAGDHAATIAARVELERPRDERHGDYATNAALLLAPLVSSSPRDIAIRLAELLASAPGVAAAEVAGPGFVNIRLDDAWYLAMVERVLADGPAWGRAEPGSQAPILLEFVSANPTGPLLAAGVRHAVFGDSLARVLRHAGHMVRTEFYINDAGRQIRLFGESLHARACGRDVPEGGYEGDYVGDLAVALGATADGSAADLGTRGVAAMLAAQQADLARIAVRFDHFQSEIELHASGDVDDAIRRLRDEGHLFDADGATFLRTTAWGDDKDRAVVRSDGGPTYFAADLAYLERKHGRVGEGGVLVLVLGADHHGYTARLRAADQALGHPEGAVEVVVMQMVNLVEQGEQRRMSKRRGDFVAAAELIDRVGVDATRYFMLQRSHDQSLDIDLDLATTQGDINPVYYVQYAHARLCSIRRRVEEEAPTLAGEGGHDDRPAASVELHQSERRLIRRMADFPTVVAEAAARRQPHRLTHYSQELASDVAAFYRDCRVLGDGIDSATTMQRLLVCDAARGVLAGSLDLIGVAAPERM